jgi:phenylalanyl-tRNA synthetase beta chain
MHGRLTREQLLQRRIEDVLVGLGLSEAYTPSLTAADPVEDALRLPEPQTVEHAVLRTTLVTGLLEATQRNLDAGNQRVGLFEIARVYAPGGAGALPEERVRVAGVVEGGFARAKGVVEAIYRALKAEVSFERTQRELLHPGRAAAVGAGWVGELDPRLLEGEWGAFELDLAGLVAAAREPVVFQDVITYPPVKQDLAFVVDASVQAGDLVAAAREAAGDELHEVGIFDVYPGERLGRPGTKSVALHVAFRSPERTLTDEDAAQLRSRIVAELERRFGAELRA